MRGGGRRKKMGVKDRGGEGAVEGGRGRKKEKRQGREGGKKEDSDGDREGKKDILLASPCPHTQSLSSGWLVWISECICKNTLCPH